MEPEKPSPPTVSAQQATQSSANEPGNSVETSPLEPPGEWLCLSIDNRLRTHTSAEMTSSLGGPQTTSRKTQKTQASWCALSEGVLPELTVPPSPAALPSLPNFEILRELGRGGMGVVYLARQVSLNRLVALKVVLAAAHAGPEDLTRFQREAEAVAQLQHPHIVQIYEVGWHDGLPYCALEYVPGGNLERYVNHRPQPPHEAAQLVARLAEAVHCAHQAGIIHRDLKPANVLLVESPPADTTPAPSYLSRVTPKITDFGLAKRLDQGSGQTRSGDILGTPSYMAPEQAAGKIEQVGPAADQYALGAILYELLTGRPPFVGFTPMETMLQVLTQEVIPPSQLLRGVPRDLETICLKCLRKDPKQRYATVQALAEDLGRFVRGEPIVARPVGRVERVWKWSRRYPAAAGLVVVTTLAAVLASGLAWWAVAAEATAAAERDQKEAQWQRAEAAVLAERQAKEMAEQHLAYAKKGTAILGSVFAGLDPKANYGSVAEFRQALQRNLAKAAAELEAGAISDPLAVAEMQTTLGNSLLGLGDYSLAITVLEKARATREQRLGLNHVDCQVTISNLAGAYVAAGKFPQAIQLWHQLHKIQVAQQGSDHTETLKTLNNLGMAYQLSGRLAEAIPLLEEVYNVQVRVLGRDHEDTLTTMNNLGMAYYSSDRLSEAIQFFEQVREGRVKKLGIDHPTSLTVTNNLAGAYWGVGRLKEATRLLEQVRDYRTKILGPDHPETLSTLNNLAVVYQVSGQLPEAILIFEQVRDTVTSKLGADHPHTLNSLNNLALAYQAAGRLSEAIQVLEHIRDAMVTKLGPEHLDTLTSLENLALAYISAGRTSEAIALLQQVRQVIKTQLGINHPRYSNVLLSLAGAFFKAGQVDQALPLFEEAAQGVAKRQFQDPRAEKIISTTITAYEKANQYDKAEAWQRQWLAVVKQRSGTGSANYGEELAKLGQLLLKQKKWADAEAVLRDCLAIRKENKSDALTTFDTMTRLGETLLRQKKYAEAEPLLLSSYQGALKHREKNGIQESKPVLLATARLLVLLYTEMNQPAAVEKWQVEISRWNTIP